MALTEPLLIGPDRHGHIRVFRARDEPAQIADAARVETGEVAADARRAGERVLIADIIAVSGDPTIAAVSSFLIGVTTVVLGASAFLRGRGESAPGA